MNESTVRVVPFTCPVARTENGIEAEHEYLLLIHSDLLICDVSRLGTLRGIFTG